MNWVHLHLALNHVPVLGALFGALLLGVGLVRRSDELQRVSLWALAAVRAAPAQPRVQPLNEERPRVFHHPFRGQAGEPAAREPVRARHAGDQAAPFSRSRQQRAVKAVEPPQFRRRQRHLVGRMDVNVADRDSAFGLRAQSRQ